MRQLWTTVDSESVLSENGSLTDKLQATDKDDTYMRLLAISICDEYKEFDIVDGSPYTHRVQ